VSSPHQTLELLARDPNSAIRAQVAANSVCSPAVVGLLSSDRDIWVRQAALRNLSCPAAILDGMSGGSQRDRWNVARNPVCPPHVLERLSLDPDRLVRRGVATNISCPDTTLGRLLSDPDPDIRCEALVNRHSRQHTSPAREADG